MAEIARVEIGEVFGAQGLECETGLACGQRETSFSASRRMSTWLPSGSFRTMSCSM